MEGKKKGSKTKNLKNLTGKKCAWCHKKVGLHRDHIWPKSKGGSNKKENIQILCRLCGSWKADKLPQEIINELKKLVIVGPWVIRAIELSSLYLRCNIGKLPEIHKERQKC